MRKILKNPINPVCIYKYRLRRPETTRSLSNNERPVRCNLRGVSRRDSGPAKGRDQSNKRGIATLNRRKSHALSSIHSRNLERDFHRIGL